MSCRTYEHTRAWKAALMLITHVYRLTQGYPAEEKSGLAGGMRKAMTTVPVKLAQAWEQEDYAQASAAVNAAQALLRDCLVQAQVSQHLAIITRHQLTDLRKRIARTSHSLDAFLDDLFEDDAQDQTLADAA